jgi:hypothetical protein
MSDQVLFMTFVELEDIPSYSTTVQVDGETLTLNFKWNTRIGKRVLNIIGSNGLCYLQNKVLLPEEVIGLNANAINNGFNYDVTLIAKEEGRGNIYNWSKHFELCFSSGVYFEE